MINQSAQGLASLGRGNDTMLMHVTPREVAGLQSLAMAQGGSLTINPQTGLPEAGFLDSIANFALPIVGGFFGLPPWATAALMGGKSLIEGDDPLQIAMSAFGGYTGGKFGSGIKEFATPLKAFSPDAPVGDFAKNLDTKKLINFGQPAGQTPLGQTPIEIAQTGFKGPAAPNFGAPKSLSTGVQSRIDLSKVPQGVGVENIGSSEFLNRQQVPMLGAEKPVTLAEGVSKVFDDPVGFARQVGEGDALMGGAQLGLYTAKPFIEDALTPEPYPGYIDPDKNKYRGDQGQLNLNPKYKTGLNLLPNLNPTMTAKEGGYIDDYATGGSIQSGGIRDLYGTPDNTPTISTGLGGFGLGRLNNLAGEQAMAQAQTLGYAHGGYLDGQGDGMSDSIPATIEGKQPARLADGEFVIPADVVSHLGNGSSKAGSKRLYAMLDKVRSARTGNKKQGKQINPAKYMPA